MRILRYATVGVIGLGLASATTAGAATKTTKKATKTTKAAVTTKATTPATTAAVTTRPATSAPAAAARTASDQGVTADTIRIATLGADLTGLIRAGVIRNVPANTYELVTKRFTYYFDKWNAAGGINGRKIEYRPVSWDPADPRSFDKACQTITLDVKPFLVVNQGGGFSTDKIPCIAGDGGVPFMGIDPVGIQTFKDSKGNLFTLQPPSEIIAAAGAELAVKSGTIPSDARVGVLRGNNQFQVDSYARAKKVLEDLKIKIVYDDVVTTANIDIGTITTNVRLAVPKMQDAGVTHVILMLPFTQAGVFPTEAKRSGFTPKYAFTEISSGMCTTFSAGQGGPDFDGATCATARDEFQLDQRGNVRPDTAFEAQCRKEYDEIYGFKSMKGVPFGAAPDSEGRRLFEDSSGHECAIANFVKEALTKSGANPTRKSFVEALATLDSFPLANFSNGKGSFGPDKPFASTALQTVKYYAGDPRATPLGGLYGRCLTPVSCFRTAVPENWTPITQTLKS